MKHFAEHSILSEFIHFANSILRLSQGLGGEPWEKGIYVKGTGKQRPDFEGTGEQRQYWGTGNIRK